MISPQYVTETVTRALLEDVGTGDLTASLIDSSALASATIITREAGILCGMAFASEAFRQTDPACQLDWLLADGDSLSAGDELCRIQGPARALLTAERTALNFIQLLSGTATTASLYAARVAHTGVKLLDTRKTLPGLRLAQKYAVACGGDMVLFNQKSIEEANAMVMAAAAGSISAAISTARRAATGKLIEVEVETAEELHQALEAGADRIMLDNFSLEQLCEAVKAARGHAELEASGNVTDETLVSIAETGVDLISIGALTKHVRALDLSMRLD